MNSARTRRLHRARQAAVVLTGIGVTATGAVAGLAHASNHAAGTMTSTSTSTSAAGSGPAASSSPVRSSSPVQPGIAAGAPQAQSGGS
jgi:hypothetical protein